MELIACAVKLKKMKRIFRVTNNNFRLKFVQIKIKRKTGFNIK